MSFGHQSLLHQATKYCHWRQGVGIWQALQCVDPKPHTYALLATKTVTPTLVFSAISDAATTQEQITKIKKTHKH